MHSYTETQLPVLSDGRYGQRVVRVLYEPHGTFRAGNHHVADDVLSRHARLVELRAEFESDHEIAEHVLKNYRELAVLKQVRRSDIVLVIESRSEP